MNTFGLKDAYLKKAYRTPFNPRENLIISKNDGLFNDEFNLIKDQLICLHYFNTLGNNKIEILEYPDGYKEEKKQKEKPKEEKKMRKIKVRRIKEN